MISSEIAQSTLRSKLPRRAGAPKSNPELLAPQDGVVLGGGLVEEKNLGHGAKISANIQEVRSTLTLSPETPLKVLNSSSHTGTVRTRSSVTRYANPAPIDINGQMWNVS